MWAPSLLANQLITPLLFQKMKKFSFLEPTLRLLILWLLLTVMITIYQNKTHIERFLLPLILTLTFIVLFFFNLNRLILFYIFFELSLVPIFLIILIWGYQSERLFASLSILLYTFIASLPLLFIVIFFNQRKTTRTLRLLIINSLSATPQSLVISRILTLAFLVKTPLYLTHIWLPKAHVEAPVFGSIILAAILLKIGTFGVLIFSCLRLRNSWFWRILALAIWRILRVALFALKIMDMKVLIAYSSVSHIGFLVALIFLNQQLRITRAALIIITHGFTSSALFFIVNLRYLTSNSRITLFNKGALFTRTYFLVWATVLIRNIRAPPTINFLAEVLGIFSILSRDFILGLCIVFFLVFTAAYSFFLFRISTQLQRRLSLSKLIAKNHYLVLLSHISPIFFLTLNISRFY